MKLTKNGRSFLLQKSSQKTGNLPKVLKDFEKFISIQEI
jgi:hypothetical protein